MATIPAQFHTNENNQGANYDYAGKPGLGTVALVAPVQIDDWSIDSQPEFEETVQMHGLRSIRGPNIATNTISAAHHQSTGGFMINYPGLRDGGTFDFEANFNPSKIGWQDMSKDEGYPAKSIMESPIFLHKDASRAAKTNGLPMLQMIVMPASMRHIWYMRGFMAMLGPATYEMEDIVKATISFKISGRPFLATPTEDANKATIARTHFGEGDETIEWYNPPAQLLAYAGDQHTDYYPAYWLEPDA